MTHCLQTDLKPLLYDGKQDGEQVVPIGEGETVQRGGAASAQVPHANALVVVVAAAPVLAILGGWVRVLSERPSRGTTPV